MNQESNLAQPEPAATAGEAESSRNEQGYAGQGGDGFANNPSRPLFELFLVAALFNLLALPALRALDGGTLAHFWAAVLAGALAGEVGALALWLVWGEGSFLRRLATHCCIGSVLWMCFLAGFAIATTDVNSPPEFRRDMVLGFCLLPLASLSAQAPMWPLRVYLGWRVERCRSPFERPQTQALSIGDILLATTVCAVTLSLVRMFPLPEGASPWSVAALLTWVVFSASFLTAIPILLLTMRSADHRFAVIGLIGYMLLVVVVLLVSLVLLVVIGAISVGIVPGETVLGCLVAFSSFTITVAAPLFVWRTHGYRLTLPRDRSTN